MAQEAVDEIIRIDFLRFLTIFFKKPGHPCALVNNRRKCNIVKFFIKVSSGETLKQGDSELDKWANGKNCERELKHIWPKIIKHDPLKYTEAIRIELNKDSKNAGKSLRELAKSCGVLLPDGEDLDTECLAYAIAKQLHKIAEDENSGETVQQFDEYYKERLDTKEKEKSGKFYNDTYIFELLRAYGDAEGKPNFNATDCNNDEDYSNDLKQRKSDFFAADKLRVNERGLYGNLYLDLKDRIYNKVEAVAKMEHKDGYQRMLKVMDRATDFKSSVLLEEKWNPIEEKHEKGACHHLVNDGKLIWVKRKTS